MSENKPPILHILVVGFHHKLGCQVEFSYPPLIVGTEGKNECPSGWKYLPTLALPDGSHNFVEDTVFFNLPSLMDPTESIYGISCYRQIPVEKLKIRTADVTRSTVQKSVSILSRLPIYGYIEVKLSLIADAFFDQGDFSCTEILVKAYQQLNACLLDDESRRPLRHFHVGLSLREIVLRWKHKTLILFKLFLLQRRVVCFGSPVREMCSLILGIASLIPRLLEKGFQEVACVRTSRPMSPMPDFTDSLKQECNSNATGHSSPIQQPVNTLEILGATHIEEEQQHPADMGNKSSCSETSEELAVSSSSPARESPDNSISSALPKELVRADSSGSEVGNRTDRSNSLTREASMDALASTLYALTSINPDEYRAPITIFSSGNLCLPYLSLPYMDLLSDPSVLSYVIGTSNVLFQQKRNLADIQVDVDSCTIDAHDQELRRQLVLSTEDLRFVDYMLRHVQYPKEDSEGSEHWIREQFQGYMLALLRTAVSQDSNAKEYDHFNLNFMGAFKKTQCFQEWYDVRPDEKFFEALPSGHPFAGTLSMTDMKLKLAQTMQSTEGGRKINQAVNTTSRAVGGAISQAKGAFSNWWSSMTTPVPPAPVSTTADSTTTDDASNPQEICVTFHNDHDDDTDEGVSFHIDDLDQEVQCAIGFGKCTAVKDNKQNANANAGTSLASSASSAGSEKLIDSAEEIIEEEVEEVEVEAAKTVCILPSSISSTMTPKEGEEAVKSKPSNSTTDQYGIVEIAKEAELLNSSSPPASVDKKTNISCIGNDANNSNRTNRSNGGVFIV